MKKKRTIRVHRTYHRKQRSWKAEITPTAALVLFLGLVSYVYIGSIAVIVYASQ